MNSTYTVMIVDDNAEDRYLLRRYLRKTKLGLVIVESSGGNEGIELLTSSTDELKQRYPGISAPITLFLDINMPLMNGWEFMEELERRRDEITLKPTVVMMYSTSDADYDKDKATSYDMVSSYLVKGESTPESLREAVLNNNL